MYLQQGDCLLFPIDKIPKDAKLRKDNVAVEGLRRHLALGKNVKVYDGYLKVGKGGCVIQHPEHGVKIKTKLTEGCWQVKRVQEYDHLREEARAIID